MEIGRVVMVARLDDGRPQLPLRRGRFILMLDYVIMQLCIALSNPFFRTTWRIRGLWILNRILNHLPKHAPPADPPKGERRSLRHQRRL